MHDIKRTQPIVITHQESGSRFSAIFTKLKLVEAAER